MLATINKGEKILPRRGLEGLHANGGIPGIVNLWEDKGCADRIAGTPRHQSHHEDMNHTAVCTGERTLESESPGF